MAAKRPPKKLIVKNKTQLTRNMLRLTLHGEDLQHFPENPEGAYFKLTFDSPTEDRPIMRTYTVANFRKDKREMDVDFMLHGNANSDGVAAPWAIQTNIGDPISIFGPGPANMINLQADWFLLAADMTALPALTCNLPLLPTDAVGYVLIEILHEEDKQELPIPETMKIIWVVNPEAGSDASPLTEAIKQVPWLDGQASVWTACEFKTMKKARQYYREEKALDKAHVYISSYWKQGLKEEEHKVVKKEDANSA